VEVIVVDDGSTDRTQDVLRPYADQINLILQPNGGVSAARNSGIKASRGDLIAFLDSDDLWVPEKLERQVVLFERDPEVSVCFSNYSFFGDPVPYETGFEERGWNIRSLPSRQIGPDMHVIMITSLVTSFLHQDTNPCWTSTVVARRSCFDEVGVFNEAYRIPSHEDWHMWLRLGKHFTFGYVDGVLARRRYRTARFSGIEEQLMRRSLADTIEMFENLDAWISLSEAERRVVRKRIGDYRFSAGYFEFSRDDLKHARAHFRRSLRCSRSWKALYYFLLSLMPTTCVKMLRSIKQGVSASSSGI